jgi:hypothetical protein
VFPAWTRGSIASEPDLPVDGLPLMLIDARTRHGQSGSPVILHSGRTETTVFTNGSLIADGQEHAEWLGVYSDRTDSESDLAGSGTLTQRATSRDTASVPTRLGERRLNGEDIATTGPESSQAAETSRPPDLRHDRRLPAPLPANGVGAGVASAINRPHWEPGANPAAPVRGSASPAARPVRPARCEGPPTSLRLVALTPGVPACLGARRDR